MNELLGGRKSSGGSNNQSSSQAPNLRTVGLLAVVGVIAWLAFGIYTVDNAQQALVLRFGSCSKPAPAGLTLAFTLSYRAH